jgi:hypothetical protein
MENEILMLMLVICLLIIYLYHNYVEKTSFILKENLKIIDADEIDKNDKYKYNNIYRKNICIDDKNNKNNKNNKNDKNNKIYREVKKSPKSILKNKDNKQYKLNKKVEIMDNDSCSIGDLLNNRDDPFRASNSVDEMKSLNCIENTLSDIESFIN